MTSRTPSTAAGRALVESARQRSSLTWQDTPNHVALVAKTVEQTTTMVLAIEAEACAPLNVERLAHKAAEIGFTYGALGRDFEYVYKNVNDMLRAALEEPE